MKSSAVFLERIFRKRCVRVDGWFIFVILNDIHKTIYTSATAAGDKGKPLVEILSARTLLEVRSWSLEAKLTFFLFVTIANVASQFQKLLYAKASADLLYKSFATSWAAFMSTSSKFYWFFRDRMKLYRKNMQKDGLKLEINYVKTDAKYSHFLNATIFVSLLFSMLCGEFCLVFH